MDSRILPDAKNCAGGNRAERRAQGELLFGQSLPNARNWSLIFGFSGGASEGCDHRTGASPGSPRFASRKRINSRWLLTRSPCRQVAGAATDGAAFSTALANKRGAVFGLKRYAYLASLTWHRRATGSTGAG